MLTEALQRLTLHQLQSALMLLTQAEINIKQDFSHSPWPDLQSLSMLLCAKHLQRILFMSNSFSKQHNLLALFGGTFDPIHFGHLRPVQALAQQVGLEKVILLLTTFPPSPTTRSDAITTFRMVKLAIQNAPLFAIDTRELEK